jgi:hypothetical protein
MLISAGLEIGPLTEATLKKSTEGRHAAFASVEYRVILYIDSQVYAMCETKGEMTCQKAGGAKFSSAGPMEGRHLFDVTIVNKYTGITSHVYLPRIPWSQPS